MTGPSEPESERRFALLKESDQHGISTEPGHGLRVHPATTSSTGEADHDRRLSSSTSSSSSGSDPFAFDADHEEIVTKSCTGDHDSAKLASGYHEDGNVPISWAEEEEEEPAGYAHASTSNNGSTTQFPLTQVMERSPDSNDPSPSYRIPSSVFARSYTNTPMEWSVASNESLFSIQNMSFTRDQVNTWDKSGELGFPGCDSTFSSPAIDISMSSQPPSDQHPLIFHRSTDEVGAINNEIVKEQYLGVASTEEPKAAETMREAVLKENKENDDDKSDKSPAKGPLQYSRSLSRRSDASVASIQSFAFPILTGDDKSYSISQKGCPSSLQPQTPKSGRVQIESQSVSQAGTTSTETAGTRTDPNPKANLNVAPGKWYSCIPCCSFCA